MKELLMTLIISCSPYKFVDESGRGLNKMDKWAIKRAKAVCGSGMYGKDSRCLVKIIKRKDGHLVALCGASKDKYKVISI